MEMMTILRKHLPEYLIEAWGLGTFMIAAGVVSTIVLSPNSSIYQAIPNPFFQRVLIGIMMGLTAIAIVYSPWGKRSGAHINPSVTFTFFRLGKVSPWDAFFYIVFQFVGGLIGILLTASILGNIFTYPPINYIVTVPKNGGVLIAFIAELFIAFVMMLTVLLTSNHQKLARFTGVFAGFLVMVYVIFESPLSGFSMNPSRTVASALPAGIWDSLWLYFIAPILGMLLAAELYVHYLGRKNIFCAKLHHENNQRCIHCQYRAQQLLINKRS